ncbi:MAG: hemolysin XhlA family protein [Ruminococcus sp.]|nr:hemolysin XhlA family protein [Ruminococcus sp.]
MTSEIILTLISFAGTVIGSLAGVFATSRLSNYRIEQLEKKVDKHNNLVERVFKLEQTEAVINNKIKTADHRIADLESKEKAHKLSS